MCKQATDIMVAVTCLLLIHLTVIQRLHSTYEPTVSCAQWMSLTSQPCNHNHRQGNVSDRGPTFLSEELFNAIILLFGRGSLTDTWY